jgi:hypothetical protein
MGFAIMLPPQRIALVGKPKAKVVLVPNTPLLGQMNDTAPLQEVAFTKPLASAPVLA